MKYYKNGKLKIFLKLELKNLLQGGVPIGNNVRNTFNRKGDFCTEVIFANLAKIRRIQKKINK